jgi:FRG domain
MSNPEEPVNSLSKFVEHIAAVRQHFRDLWNLADHKELWFRGESRDYGDTILRPELYRPAQGLPLKPITKLLAIENDLYEEFRRIAVELAHEKTTDEDWYWDSYFLMQHHGAPTRLLDWSDGALMALHFALRNKSDDSHDARVYILDPDALAKRLKQSSDIKKLRRDWKV